jgi:hypothetical protein
MLRIETFVEADVEIRYEVSCLEHAAGASAAVICGRGYLNSNSNWENVSSRLKTTTHLEGVLLRALSVRMFYKHTATGDELLSFTLVGSSDFRRKKKQTSHLFIAFSVRIVRQSRLYLAALSRHGTEMIGIMHYVYWPHNGFRRDIRVVIDCET